MKKILTILGLILFYQLSWAQAPNTFMTYMNGNNKEFDINNDGTPDIMRTYKKGRLTQEVFRHPKTPNSWQKTLFHKRSIETTIYVDNRLIKVEKETLHPNGYDIEQIHPTTNRKYFSRIRGTTIHKAEYIKENKGWKPTRFSTFSAEKIFREVTTFDSYQEEVAPTPTRQYSERLDQPTGFRLGPSCSGEVKNWLIKSTHYFFKNLLPCLHGFHPDLAWALARNIRKYKTVIKCDEINSTDAAAYTYTMRNAPITLGRYGNPANLARGILGVRLSETDVLNNTANTLMHEALHNLGIRHSHNGSGKVDPAYGCENLCNTVYNKHPGLAMISYQSGCQQCLGTRVNGKLPGTMNRCNSR